jgi:hypothetical protein
MLKSINISLFLIFLILSVSAKKERLIFDLKYGFAKGGEVVLIITDTTFNGLPSIHYNLIGSTTGITKKLYDINDVYETTVDAKTWLPLKSIRNIKEGKYRSYNETLYYHDIDSIYSLKSGRRAVPENLVDIISVFFYFINYHLFEDIVSGTIVTLPTYHADKISNVTIKYLGERKTETDLGKINTYVLSPLVEKGKLLNRSDGIKFYVSKKKKIPVLLEFDMKFGSLKALLKSYKIDGVEQVTI